MKHLFLFFLLFVAGRSLAQRAVDVAPPRAYQCAEPIGGVQHRADSLLALLDKSQIPTHILYDRVPALAQLRVFGQHAGNADTSSVQHFLQAYYELRTAAYTADGRPCRQLLADNAQTRSQRDTVLLGALRFRFNYIDPLALQDNVLRRETTDSSRLLDVPGRSRSPYLLREVAVAAALVAATPSQNVRFLLDPASVFTNTGSAA